MLIDYDLTITKKLARRILCAVFALSAASLAVAADGVPIPNFWDPQHRVDRPETSSIRVIRFVTEWPMSSSKIQKFRLRTQLVKELGLE